jgi:hypothetical protein
MARKKEDKEILEGVPFEEDITISDDPFHVAGAMQILLKRHNKIGEKLVYFWVYGVDSSWVLGATYPVAMSPTSEPVIEPANVFSFVKKKELQGIVLVTNHLDESIEPTEWDKKTAKGLIYASMVMRIPILEYLIINDDRYYSFKATGLLDEIEQACTSQFQSIL